MMNLLEMNLPRNEFTGHGYKQITNIIRINKNETKVLLIMNISYLMVVLISFKLKIKFFLIFLFVFVFCFFWDKKIVTNIAV